MGESDLGSLRMKLASERMDLPRVGFACLNDHVQPPDAAGNLHKDSQLGWVVNEAPVPL